MVVVLVIVGALVFTVAASIVAARRGSPVAFEPTDPNVERAHVDARHLRDGMGPWG